MEFQLRPEHAIPTELATDVRVRQAVAHLIDRAALLEAITNSRGLSRDLYTPPRRLLRDDCPGRADHLPV